MYELVVFKIFNRHSRVSTTFILLEGSWSCR